MKKQSSAPKNLRQKQGGSCSSDDDFVGTKLVTSPLVRKRRKATKPQTGLFYSTDWAKSALISNFQKRNWQQVPAFEGDWNFYWASTQNCRYIFGIDHPYRMRSDQ